MYSHIYKFVQAYKIFRIQGVDWVTRGLGLGKNSFHNVLLCSL